MLKRRIAARHQIRQSFLTVVAIHTTLIGQCYASLYITAAIATSHGYRCTASRRDR
jgi:hypothetical protein